jgi:hypothetical protein
MTKLSLLALVVFTAAPAFAYDYPLIEINGMPLYQTVTDGSMCVTLALPPGKEIREVTIRYDLDAVRINGDFDKFSTVAGVKKCSRSS